jgi:glycosyltransferase involved in cell wall biosynthesis
MQILHVCPSQSFSGLEQYAFELALNQKRQGLAVGFVVAPNTELEKKCLDNGIQTVLCNPYIFMGVPKFWLEFKKLLKRNDQIKVIHMHSTQELNHLFLPLLLKKIKAQKQKFPKIILQIHIWINHVKKDFFHRLLYSFIDEIWCSSIPHQKALLEALPVSLAKIKIVNYGRDVDLIEKSFLSKSEAREKLGLPEHEIIFATVSRIEKSKGILEFIKASQTLLAKNENLGLAVIGGVSPNNAEASQYNDEMLKWVSTLAPTIKKRIYFLGSKSNSFQYLKAFDVYVLPSYQECFSLSLLDAQLAALPVVGSRAGGTPEIVCDTKTGWLFEPGDSADLEAKLKAAFDSHGIWKTYGENASLRVKKDFDQKNIFQKILKEYALT